MWENNKLILINMKKILGGSLLLTLIISLTLINKYRFLIKEKSYTIKGKDGIIIPARIFVRRVSSNGTITKRILIFFDKEIGMNKIFDVIVILPEYKMIGIPEKGINGYLKLSDEYIYQKSLQSDNFTSILNNYSFFKDSPIKFAKFQYNEISFNSFDKLKKYGDILTITSSSGFAIPKFYHRLFCKPGCD